MKIYKWFINIFVFYVLFIPENPFVSLKDWLHIILEYVVGLLSCLIIMLLLI